MYRLRQTDVFEKWLLELRDMRAKARILAVWSRLASVILAMFGPLVMA